MGGGLSMEEKLDQLIKENAMLHVYEFFNEEEIEKLK